MLLIWDAMSNYIREHLEAGRSVNVPSFGTMTFEPILCEDPYSNKEQVKLRPCLIVNPKLRETLYRFPAKEQIRTAPNSGSVYENGRGATFLNVKPIAAGCYYKQEVISSAIKSLFQGVIDLVKRDYNLHLDFNGVRVIIINRNLQTKYDMDLVQTVQQTLVKTKAPPIHHTWKKAKLSASMMNFIDRPSSPDMVAMRNRTAHLSILSLDMNSCAMQKSRSTPALLKA
jgi:hypothetical protein